MLPNAPDLREQLDATLKGRVCLMGMGNTDYGDDGFGVQLVEELAEAEVSDVIVAGSEPEGWVGIAAEQDFDHVVFLDAVEFGGAPGAVVFLDAKQLVSRFPQVSTHKISLGLLAKFIESNGITKVWLLGVQPESTREEQMLSPTVRATMEVLRELLFRLKTRDVTLC
jgi:hydrogenase 3 maturation protease